MNDKFLPGTCVYVVERDEYGEAVDVSGYMLLAVSDGAVIVSPYVDDLETLEDTLKYHIGETAMNYDTRLSVFPADDCHLSREDAKAAIVAEETQ